MRLFHYRHRNFGDAINGWLWPRLIPDVLDDDDRAVLIGIGTILNDRVPMAEHKVVFGSGVGYRRPPSIDGSWTIYCVRGPVTARALGLAPDAAVTDGAALIRLISLPPTAQVHDASYVPHWQSDEYWSWREVCEAAGVHYIDPLSGVEQVIRDIRGSRVVYAEAMHAAILADALRVPWVPVRAYRHVLRIKWVDWCASLGLGYQPERLPALYGRERVVTKLRTRSNRQSTAAWLRLGLRGAAWAAEHAYERSSRRQSERAAAAMRRVVSTATPRLSDDHVIQGVTHRLEERLEAFKRDHRGGRFG
jgi:succinoglycan biosynthesis protein ExoV